MDEKDLQIRGRLTSIKFEKIISENLKKISEQLKSEIKEKTEVSIDLSKLLWVDLLETMSLPIIADLIVRTFPNSTPIFKIYIPNILLKEDHLRKIFNFPAEKTKRILDERSKTRRIYNAMRENVFHWALWEWKFIHFIRIKNIDLYLVLEKQKYLWKDLLFSEKNISKSRKDSTEVLNITPIFKNEDLPLIRVKIENCLKKHIPNSKYEEIIDFSHLIHRLCENVCAHAYKINDLLPKTGAVAIRKLSPKGLVEKVNKRRRKDNISLKEAKIRVFKDLQMPENIWSFYDKYYKVQIFEVVVVDGGEGVYKTLKKVYKKTHNDKEGKPFEVLEYAFKEGTTSRRINKNKSFDKNEIGLGLFKVKKQVLEWDGLIEMRSCNSRITFSADYKEGLPPDPQNPFKEIAFFPGTQLRVLIPKIKLNRQLNLF
jgi:hypothetical protein